MTSVNHLSHGFFTSPKKIAKVAQNRVGVHKKMDLDFGSEKILYYSSLNAIILICFPFSRACLFCYSQIYIMMSVIRDCSVRI